MEQEILKAPDLSKDVIMRRMHRVNVHSSVHCKKRHVAELFPCYPLRHHMLTS